MSTDSKKRFTVISNEEMVYKEKKREVNNNYYHSNPLTEKFVKFANGSQSKKFSVEDLLKW